MSYAVDKLAIAEIFTFVPTNFMRFSIFLLFLLFQLNLVGQFAFRYENDIPLSIQGTQLPRAWEGGINSAQFQKMDLNNDGTEDLIIFHRMSNEITTYLAIENQFVWAPEYKSLFPREVQNWMILTDYNCDGKKDIFTSVPQGITVFENTSDGDLPQWQRATDYLRFDSGTNIQVNASDIPGIADVNGDGILDILSYRFTTASTIDYYQGTGNCGSLSFTRVTRKWGDLAECTCNYFAFGDNACNTGGAANLENEINRPEQTEHAGGKTITVFDADNDGDLDLITSDEFCETLYFMVNEGDAENAKMTSFISYPQTNPAGFKVFPNAFLEDVDFDGNKDLIISSNADNNNLNLIDFTLTSKVYTNLSSNSSPDFSGKAAPFFQPEMLDLGEDVYPAFADYDRDGDFDLFIGTKGLPEGSSLTGGIFLFKNSGGRFEPAFELEEEDFLNFREQNLRNIKPQFVDIDRDGNIDLIYQSTSNTNQTSLQYKLNQGDFSFGESQPISVGISENDNAYFYDINADGSLDLLLATRLGALDLYINQGDFSFGEVVEDFAGIASDFDTRNPSVSIADLDNNGTTELIKTDITGQISIFSGAINTSFSPTSNTLNLLMDTINGPLKTTSISETAHVVAADIFGTGKPALILGNNRGGINIFRNESEKGTGTSEQSIQLTVFPNPASNSFSIKTDTNATLEIYSLLGQKIAGDIHIAAGISKEISCENMAAGIYLIKVFNGVNKPAVQRIIVQK